MELEIVAADSGMNSFTERLEDEARRLVLHHADERFPSSGESFFLGLEREIALTLHHLDRAREFHELQRRALTQTECYVETELMQMESRTPRYAAYRFPEREKLQRRLAEIDSERRRGDGAREELLRRLHDRLLALMQRQSQLMPPLNHGDRNAGAQT